MPTKKKSVPALRSRLMSALRKTWRHSPEYRQALDEAKSAFSVPSKTGKPMRRVHWHCAECHQFHPLEGVQVAHTLPVVLLTGFDSWDGVIRRMFCPASDLRVICKHCHMQETLAERAMRQALKPPSEAQEKKKGARSKRSGKKNVGPGL
jgi:ribosomal protein S21